MTNIKLLVLDQPVYEVTIETLFYIRRSITQEPTWILCHLRVSQTICLKINIIIIIFIYLFIFKLSVDILR